MANDLGTINIVVQVEGQQEVKSLSTTLNQVAAANNKVSNSARQVISNLRRGRAAMREMAAANTLAGASFSRLNLNAVAKNINNLTSSTLRYNRAAQQSMQGANRFGMVSQQVGYQVGDFFVQVQSGTNALTAFGQQATQLAGLLPGLAGAVVGIGVSLGTALGMAALRSQELTINFQKIGQDIASALSPIQGLIDAIGTGLSYAGQAAAKGLGVLIQNLDRIFVYATTIAALFAGKYVAGLVAATIATASLSGALLFLRGALIKTGIGALVVLAGELILQFTRLVSATGGFGQAINLLADVASEAWNRMSLSASAMWASVESAWANGQSTIYRGLQATTDAVVSWGNTTAGVFQGSFDAMKAIWGTLPAAIGDFTIQAANSVISGVEAMLNAVVQRINGFITSLSSLLSKVPGMGDLSLGLLEEVNLGGIENQYAGAGTAAGKAAGAAFSKAMDQTYVQSPNLFGGLADAATDTARGFDEAAGKLTNAANKPMTAWEKLKSVFTGTTEEAVDMSGWLTKTEDAAKGSAKGAKEADKAFEELRKELESPVVSAIDSVSSAFGNFISRGLTDFKGFVQDILGSFQNMIAQMIAMAVKNRIMLSLGVGGLTPGMAAAGQIPGLGSAGGMLGSLGIGKGIAGLAGGTGFLGGAGNAIAGLGGGGAGFLSIGANAAAAGGSLAATIGALAPPLLAVAAVFSFFKKKTKELDSGLRVTVTNMDAFIQTFRTTETKRFWGLSKKTKTSVETAGADITDPFVQAVQGMQEQVVKAAAVFGIAEDQFANFAYNFEVSLKGLTDEQKAQKLTEELTKMGDAFASMIPEVSSLNELLEAAQQRYDLQTRLLQLQGKEEELIARQREAELAAVHPLNKELLTRIHSLEQEKMAAEKAIAAAQQAREAAQQAANVATSAVQTAFTALTASIRASVDAIVSDLRSKLELANDAVTRSRDIFSQLQSALSGRYLGSGVEASKFRQSSALSFLGKGNFQDVEALKEALDVVGQPTEDLYGSFEDYARNFYKTSAIITGAKSVAERQLSQDERQVDLLEEQIVAAEAQYQIMVDQYGALLGIDNSVLSLSQAISNLSNAIAAETAAKQAVENAVASEAAAVSASQQAISSINKNIEAASIIDQLYASGGYSRTANQQIYSDWVKYAETQGTQKVVQTWVNLGNMGTIKGYANGGMHSGGVRLVGEEGPELEFTGPSRIASNRQSASMFRDPELRDAVMSLKNEVSGLRSEQLQIQMDISKYTKRSYDIERKWDVEGLPATRT